MFIHIERALHPKLAARALSVQALAQLNEPQTIEGLQSVYPKPTTPVRAMYEAEPPPLPRMTEASVRQAAHKINQFRSEPGPIAAEATSRAGDHRHISRSWRLGFVDANTPGRTFRKSRRPTSGAPPHWGRIPPAHPSAH